MYLRQTCIWIQPPQYNREAKSEEYPSKRKKEKKKERGVPAILNKLQQSTCYMFGEGTPRRYIISNFSGGSFAEDKHSSSYLIPWCNKLSFIYIPPCITCQATLKCLEEEGKKANFWMMAVLFVLCFIVKIKTKTNLAKAAHPSSAAFFLC